jgi:hypothetical protein
MTTTLFLDPSQHPPTTLRNSFLWEHYLYSIDATSVKVKCKYCNHVFLCSSTRMYYHLSGEANNGVMVCTGLPPMDIPDLRKKRAKKDLFEEESLLGSSSSTRMSDSSPSNSRSSISSAISRESAKAELDLAVLTFIAGACLPFSTSENQWFRSLMETYQRVGYEGYTPPTQEWISANMKLDIGNIHNLQQNIWNHISTKFDLCVSIFGAGLSIDGWSQNARVIQGCNLLTTEGTVFLGSSNQAGKKKDAENLFEYIISLLSGENENLIKQTLLRQVFYIVTDGAAANRKMGKKLKTKGIWNIWCTTHVLNLCCRDIMTLPSFKLIFDKVEEILHVFTGWDIPRTAFRRVASRMLVKNSQTRFCVFFLCIQSVLSNWSNLRIAAADQHVQAWIQTQTNEKKLQFNKVEALLIDQTFKEQLFQVKNVLHPVVLLLRESDRTKPFGSWVYLGFERLLMHLQILDEKGFANPEEKLLLLNKIKKYQTQQHHELFSLLF